MTPVLDAIERNSPTWLKIKEYLEAELAKLRRSNDSQDLSETQTASLRGEIARIKVTLTLGDTPNVVVDDNAVFKD